MQGVGYGSDKETGLGLIEDRRDGIVVSSSASTSGTYHLYLVT